MRLAPALALFLATATAAVAAFPTETPSIAVSVHQSKIVPLTSRAKKVFLTRPEIAEVQVLGPRSLLVNGMSVGTTSLVVWDEAGQVSNIPLTVTPNIDGLREQIRALFPNELIQVSSSGGAIVLQGTVSNEVVYDKVLEFAEASLPPALPKETAPATAAAPNFTVQTAAVRLPQTGTAFAGGGQQAFLEEGSLTDSNRWGEKRQLRGIIDLLVIKDFRQIEIGVIVAEVSLTKLREIGFDISGTGGNWAGSSLAGTQAGFTSGPLQLENLDTGFLQVLNLASASGSLGYFGGAYNIAAAFRLFQSKDAANILAEPKLVIKNGRSGSFLSGGEFPFPAPQGGGDNESVTVEFRPFGVRLEFVPTITWSNTIDLKVFPEVSDIDRAASVTVGGLSVPGLRVRRSVSRVELRENETLVIGGLLDRRTVNDLSKYPFVGDLPILGTLFRSTKFRNQETELVFAITPRLVKPLPPGSQIQVPILKPNPSSDPELRQIPLPATPTERRQLLDQEFRAESMKPVPPSAPNAFPQQQTDAGGAQWWR